MLLRPNLRCHRAYSARTEALQINRLPHHKCGCITYIIYNDALLPAILRATSRHTTNCVPSHMLSLTQILTQYCEGSTLPMLPVYLLFGTVCIGPFFAFALSQVLSRGAGNKKEPHSTWPQQGVDGRRKEFCLYLSLCDRRVFYFL